MKGNVNQKISVNTDWPVVDTKYLSRDMTVTLACSLVVQQIRGTSGYLHEISDFGKGLFREMSRERMQSKTVVSQTNYR